MSTTPVTTAVPTRPYQGGQIPVAGTYQLDTAHTTVEFVARHLMITKVRGRFARFGGTVHIGEVPEKSSVAVTIDAASVDTSQDQRDAHLRSADFLDVENHATLDFTSTGVADQGDGRWAVTGDLTIRGTTRPVVLDVEFDGGSVTPWGSRAVAFSASTEIDREDWGLTYNQALETGGVVVSKKVRIELNVEAVLDEAAPGQAGSERGAA